MTTGSVFVGATAVYAALRNHTRQLNAQIFLAYSDRLQTIRRARGADLISLRQTDDISPESDAELSAGAIETLHLVFELYELKQQGYIRGGLWPLWQRDTDRLLNSPAIRQSHEHLKREFEGHPRFIAWVEERQRVVLKPNVHRRGVRSCPRRWCSWTGAEPLVKRAFHMAP